MNRKPGNRKRKNSNRKVQLGFSSLHTHLPVHPSPRCTPGPFLKDQEARLNTLDNLEKGYNLIGTHVHNLRRSYDETSGPLQRVNSAIPRIESPDEDE